VPHDNPDITANARCRDDAGVTVPAGIAGGVARVLAGGTPAMHRIEAAGPAEIGDAAGAMYGEWLPGSGLRADDRPPPEIYHDTAEPRRKTRIVLNFCIPIGPP